MRGRKRGREERISGDIGRGLQLYVCVFVCLCVSVLVPHNHIRSGKVWIGHAINLFFLLLALCHWLPSVVHMSSGMDTLIRFSLNVQHVTTASLSKRNIIHCKRQPSSFEAQSLVRRQTFWKNKHPESESDNVTERRGGKEESEPESLVSNEFSG